MTVTAADAPLKEVEVPEELLDKVASSAPAVDRGDALAREAFPLLGDAGLTDLGAPNNAGGGLLSQAAVIEKLAQRSLASGFALWGHRMCIEYLSTADTDYAREVLPGLRAGTTPGISGMASAFKTFAGAGTLDLTAERDGGSLILNGRLPWATNLYPDALVASAARETTAGAQESQIVIAFTLATQGVHVGRDLDLLALQGTASTYLTLQDVRIPVEQVLSTDFDAFVAQCRPSVAILQAAFCLGLATASFRMVRANISGINEVFDEDFRGLEARLLQTKSRLRHCAELVSTEEAPARTEVLGMRLEAGQLAVALTSLEAKTSGGKGYVVSADANRRFREAAFLPVQSPSEAQLRWELAKGR